ncbi:MAG: hypothetical protein INQ03_00915 [Candidatus Heimdallarchaeota archaeon]|nr:hypothetical protein [Candidatus Heimdallarchaeota archaeon]
MNIQTDLRFDSYKLGYEREQVQIAEEVQKTWPWPHYYSEEVFRRRYSHDDFDPDFNLYCFYETEMIGFINAMEIKLDNQPSYAYLDFPYINPKLENREEIDRILFEKMIEILKDKGFNTVETAATTFMRNRYALAIERGFSEIEGEELGAKMYLNYKISQKSIGSYKENIRDYDPKTDLDLCAREREKFVNTVHKVSIFTWEKKSLEEIRSDIQKMDNKRIFANLVIIHNDELKSHCTAVLNRYNPDICAIGYLYAKDEYYFKEVLARLSEICEDNKVGNLLIDLMGNNLRFEHCCLNLGFQKVESWAGMRLSLDS